MVIAERLMKYQRVWTRNATGLASTLALLGSWGCSLLYDFNTHQCDNTQDCLNQGPQFINSICDVPNHVCVQTSGNLTGGAPGFGGATSIGGAANGGGVSPTGGRANTSLGGAPTGGDSSVITLGGATSTQGGGGGVVASGGIPTAGDASTGGAPVITGGAVSTGGAATGGAGSTAECATNADCFRLHSDQASICRSGSCVLLTNSNCPVLIPALTATKLLKEQAPIIVGGFSNLTDSAQPHNSVTVLNWDLAFDEFNSHLLGSGLPSYPAGGATRPFVGVICQGYNSAGAPQDIAGSMAHLVNDIGVTSVLSAMQTPDLYNAFYPTIATGYNVFFMNTGLADLKLVNTPNNGMLFHMLGDPHMLTTTVVSLFHQIEPQVYKQRLANYQATGQDNPDTVPLRVTLVHSDNTQMIDSHDLLISTATDHPESHLSFNGKTWTQNYATGDAREARKVTSNAAASDSSITDAIAEIQAHPPHVIVGMATPEFAYIMNTVEVQWANTAPNQPRPYYVVSNWLYHAKTLFTDSPRALMANDTRTPPLRLRVAGVSYASAQDQRSQDALTAYLNRLILANPSFSLSLSGYENHYDGAYYLLYAIAAAAAHRAGTPSSSDILSALTSKVINPRGTIVDIGPDSQTISNTVTKFFNDPTFTMALWGTMGFPNFDPLLGTRVSQTSAWCCQKDATQTWVFMPDGIIYDPVANLFSPNKNGMPACIQAYCPQNADAGVGICPESY
jgi:hypothetical protein